MSAEEFNGRSNLELLRMHSRIIEELRRRDVLRSKNNPVGDYAEWLVATTFGWTLERKSAAGYDATDAAGLRYQIKARRVTADNGSKQLGAIRKLDTQPFDHLVGVLFDQRFNVLAAYRISIDTVRERATFKPHTNAHVLHLQGALLADPRVEDWTGRFQV